MTQDQPAGTAAHADCPVCQVGGVGKLDIAGPPCERCGMGWDACYDREHDGFCCPDCHHHGACDCFTGRFGPVPKVRTIPRGRGA